MSQLIRNADAIRTTLDMNRGLNARFNSLASTLFSTTPISAVIYRCFNKHGQLQYLSTDLDWAIYRTTSAVPWECPTFAEEVKRVPLHGSQNFLWNQMTNLDHPICRALYDRNICHGFNIYQRNDDDSVEVFSFATHKENNLLTGFYLNYLPAMHDFIDKFRRNTPSIIMAQKGLISTEIQCIQACVHENDKIAEFTRKLDNM